MSTELLVKVGCLFGFFVSYNLWLLFFPVTKREIYDNVERTEEFLFSGKKHDCVLVGSGLIGTMETAAFNHAFKLYFPYYGSCTGLEIIALSGKIPAILLVETNYIFKGINEELIDRVFTKHAGLKRYLPFLLRKHQPLNLIKTHLKQLLRKDKKAAGPVEAAKNEQALAVFIDLYKDRPEQHKFFNDINHLKSNIELVVSKGCEVIFFESPMDPVLEDAPLFHFQRQALREMFSENDFRWIRADQHDAYETEDGIHLTHNSLQKFTKYIEAQISEVIV
jgi:hypothetical protein